ncbi:ACT domain-containing protein [Brevibacillus sp. SYSU BS000544]|uniref:ACT domain-containing protein n=1 Tax=Brevibacillus sp. SYSU BS000544 TaxID=3416443 RepID=UPI003CE5466B
MDLKILSETYCVMKLPSEQAIPDWALADKEFFSITGTPEELSIVCSQKLVPSEVTDIVVESDWRCIKVEGQLDFSLTGILSSLANPLAQNKVSIFAISTFNTDYLLVKQAVLEKTVHVLQQEGHNFLP